MIAPSLAAFINAQAELSSPASVGLGIRAFSKTEDTVLGELVAPYALVSPMTEGNQELWAIGDAQRKENPLFQVAFYCVSSEQRSQAEARFRRLIEAATATDVNGVTHPGIDYIAYADLLRDNGDHANFLSDQPSWFSSPTPIIYKNEDSAGEPVVVSTGRSIDLTLGKVTFSPAITAGDRVRATYKVGVIDFNIMAVNKFPDSQETDVVNNPARYVVVFGLETFFYIKTKANRYL